MLGMLALSGYASAPQMTVRMRMTVVGVMPKMMRNTMHSENAMHTMTENTVGPTLEKALPTPSITKPARTVYIAFQLEASVGVRPFIVHHVGE